MKKKFYVQTGCNQMVLIAKSEIEACKILINNALSTVKTSDDEDVWFDEHICISEAGFPKDIKGTSYQDLAIVLPTSAILIECGQEKMAEMLGSFFDEQDILDALEDDPEELEDDEW
jgi:hypothetical protein